MSSDLTIASLDGFACFERDEDLEDRGGTMKVGALVRMKISDDGTTYAAQRYAMYNGWLAVVTSTHADQVCVDSDMAWKRIGRGQAVSFRGWFPISEVELVEEAK
jgi:hypothetical protein